MYSTTIKATVVMIIAILQTNSYAALDGSLHHFEVLHDEEINHRITKRSLAGEDDILERDVQFESLGKKFDLKLTKREGLFSPGFKAYAIDKNNKQRDIDVETKNFFFGYNKEEPWSSTVNAFWDETNSLTAKIKTKHEVYVIEPAWRHLDHVHNNSMIAYKESDIILDRDMGDKYCGFVNPELEYSIPPTSPAPDNITSADEPHDRVKRQSQSRFNTPTHTTCPLLLVADYRFFQTMGQNSLSQTTSYLIGLIDRVDSIYRATDFGKGFLGMGFEIKEIRVHEAPTKTDPHYNKEQDEWETKKLLEQFSADKTFRGFCLAHLFTHQAFSGGVLGLAYISSPRKYSVGGVCSPVYYKQGRELYLNTGWSSSLNRYKRRLLTSEADLVTTHEFGHNWGSEHDPDTDECSPSSFGGGKYIMYTYSVSGYDKNNKIFSPCSRRGISAVLEAKHDICFRLPSDGFCGNMRVEGKEECDPGPEVSKDQDPCCDQFCRLRPNKICSDVNSVCCQNCNYAPTSTVCHPDQEFSCEGEAYCSGTSDTCPAPSLKEDDTECIGGGKCNSGVCVQFCESKGLESCICDEEKHYCHRCCRDPRNPSSNCTANANTDPGLTYMNLPNGVSCALGYCNEGICEKQVENLVERIWDIIENITTSNFVEFMRANIVGTVIVFSLVLWIPLSCVISYFDRKRRRAEEERIIWHASDNKDLLSDLDRSTLTIHRSKHVRAREPRPMYKQPEDNGQYVARAVAPDRRTLDPRAPPARVRPGEEPPPAYDDFGFQPARQAPTPKSMTYV